MLRAFLGQVDVLKFLLICIWASSALHVSNKLTNNVVLCTMLSYIVRSTYLVQYTHSMYKHVNLDLSQHRTKRTFFLQARKFVQVFKDYSITLASIALNRSGSSR